jgi:hypothetical protein
MMNTRNGNKKVTLLPKALAHDDNLVFGEMRDAGPAAAPREAAGAAAASRAAAGAAAAPRAAAPAVDIGGAAAAPAANVDAGARSLDEILESLQAVAEQDLVGEKRKREENERQLEFERREHQKLMKMAQEKLEKHESALRQAKKLSEIVEEKTSASRAVFDSLKSKTPQPSQAEIDQARRIMQIAKSLEPQKKPDDDEPKEDEAGPNAVLNGGLLMAGNAVVGVGDLLRQASESVTLQNVVVAVAGGLFLTRLFR